MAVLSVLRCSDHQWKLLRPLIRHALVGQTRSIGAAQKPGRQMNIVTSIYQWYKFKNMTGFYIWLGVIPLTIITTLVNIFIGAAELAETPDGYVPEYHEYHKFPVTRLIAKYNRDPRFNHELLIARMHEESERMILSEIVRQVKWVMRYNQDYSSWYYNPVWGEYHRQDRADMKLWYHKIDGEESNVATEWMFSKHGDPNPPPAR